jgi:hypothetical protein
VREALGEDPFSGTIFQTSRPRKDFGVGWAGLVLFWKRLEHGAFRWPPDRRWHHAIVCVAGSDWSRLQRAMLYGRPQRHERCDFLNYAHDADHNGTRVNYSSVACERDRPSAS